MNRPTNVPQPPPPNMPRHLTHGHHNMRAPPTTALQQVAAHHALPPPPPPMGYAPPPQMVPNVQQRSNRTQNYHSFMETPNSGAIPPYMHYNRMGGNQGNKKYHYPSLNKPRAPKPTAESHHHQQQQQPRQHHQTLQSQPQQQLTHPNYSNVPPYILEVPTTSSAAATHETRRSLQQNQVQDSYTPRSKKFNENPRHFETNVQQAAVPSVTSLSSSVPRSASVESNRNATVEDMPVSSTKTLSVLEKSSVLLPLDEEEAKAKGDEGNHSRNNDGNENAHLCQGETVQEKPLVIDEANIQNENLIVEKSNSETNDENVDLKSSREKTPMCLVNDLARFNKISFQYRLTGENGPAHCKRFTVTLKLGDEEYMAEGMKIKEAQHLAAKEAIQKTKYKHPIPKTNRRHDDQSSTRVNVTPTVELNALAMKLGLQTYYIFDPRQPAANVADNKNAAGPGDKGMLQPRYRVAGGLGTGIQNQIPGSAKYVSGAGTFVPSLAHPHQHNPGIMHHVQQAAHHRGAANYPHCYPILPPHMMAAATQHHVAAALFSTPCRITLIVGTQKFVGTGRTIQQAKHDAAAQAIESLKEEMNSQQKENADDKSEDAENKSPISLVFEIGIKRNLPVDFKILREDGPAHMRTFTTACIVGQIETVAEGTGKKISKKKAAQKMLEELNKLPPIATPTNSPTKRVKSKGAVGCPRKSGASAHGKGGIPAESKEVTPRTRDKSKKRSSTVSVDAESDPSNPITKLIELFQHNKEKEPVFKLITEGGKERARQRQFVVEVSSKDITARGVGNSKKSARRNAAQNFLMSLGADGNDKTTTEVDAATSQVGPTATGRVDTNDVLEKSIILNTVAPVILAKDTAEITGAKKKEPKIPAESVTEIELSTKQDDKVEAVVPLKQPEVDKPTPVSSPNTDKLPLSTTTTTATTATTTTTTKPGLYMKDKLLYLARLMGFEVDFSDYPKGNHNEFLSIVMISTNPPQICHGIGANAAESQEDAASNALKILSEMGLSK